MTKRKYTTGKKIKEWFENHPVWVLLGIVSSVLTLAIAAGTVFSLTTNFVENNILWRNVEQDKIDKLAPTQTINYFNSVLGEPNVKKGHTEKISTYIYRERGYWIEAFVDHEGVVQLMDITACGEEGFYPIIKNNPVGYEIVLGKTKMIATTGKDVWQWNKDNGSLLIHYFMRGATAPSYYYDEYYGGNPSNYQTVFSGHNELCGYLILPNDISDLMSTSGKGNLSEEQVERLRKNVSINTFAVSAPSYSLKLGDAMKNIGEGGIGVSYVDEGVLMPTKKIDKIDEKFKEAKDFDVISTVDY
jgi:hypothetical protein